MDLCTKVSGPAVLTMTYFIDIADCDYTPPHAGSGKTPSTVTQLKPYAG